MYLVIVTLLMLVLPVGSIAAEYFSGGAAPLMLLVGKWFVFWSVGVRLLLVHALISGSGEGGSK